MTDCADINVGDCFSGSGLIVAPHMDDEVLACGGLIAQLPQKARWHIVYATNGFGSPEPVIPWRDKISGDLGAVRRTEARDAMVYLGMADENLHFLDLPDGKLRQHRAVLSQKLIQLIHQIKPQHVLVPFRFDRHPDHLAICHCLTASVQSAEPPWQLTEYFVYHHWRLLPKRDVRCYIHPYLLSRVDTTAVAAQKRAALDFFKSQTTCFYPWQTRPNLTPELLDSVSRESEYFLRYDSKSPGPAIFARATLWIRVAHRLEPILKKRKDRFVAWLRWGAKCAASVTALFQRE